MVAALTCVPALLRRGDSPDLIALRWRCAYARGLIRAAFHWHLNLEG
ncbi:MAG TPA: hypothetical protein VFE41_03990 [Acetobacteraceae bacterium]|nr:hypothetical protein [Acetobacteraceae bacterium]